MQKRIEYFSNIFDVSLYPLSYFANTLVMEEWGTNTNVKKKSRKQKLI